jgi:hypothetical protein
LEHMGETLTAVSLRSRKARAVASEGGGVIGTAL